MPGYTPQIGTLVSEMTWMRGAVLSAVKGITQDQLDFLLDAKANVAAPYFSISRPPKSYIR